MTEPPCGFQITFFRSRTGHADANPSRFAPKQLLFAHAALALPESGRLTHEERAARAGPGGVRYSETDTEVAIGDWSFIRDAQTGIYQARIVGRDLDMNIAFTPAGPPVLQGVNGYSQKGPRPEQSSHYYSEPQLKVSGRIAAGRGASQRAWQATGRAWLDHEWSDELLHPEAVGWDWIGMNLDDGSALTAFRLRRADGSALWAGGSFRRAGQTQAQDFPSDTVRFEPGRRWRSPTSGGDYPVAWTVHTPAGRFSVQALLDAQELDSRSSTGTVYWEGLSELHGDAGRRIGLGYLEMTGYAGRLVL